MDFSKLSIGRRLITVTLLSLVGMVVLLLLFYKGLSTSVVEEKKSQSKTLSQMGVNIVQHFYELQQIKKLEKNEAQAFAIDTLQSAKYNQNGYFWIQNSDALLIMHPHSKKLVNLNNLDTVDSEGKYLYREFTRVAKAGGGFVAYSWQKPNTQKSFEKLSYVTYFEPWDWIIGTGVYLDDIEEGVNEYAISALSIVVLFSIVLVSIAMMLTRRMVLQLNDMAIYDPLTQLYTRRYLNENLESILSQHKRQSDKYLSVIFFDLDFFKNINDTYGHAYGDKVLARVAEVIKTSTRLDELCVRYGGEEFLVIVFADNKDSVITLAERIRKKVGAIVFKHNTEKFSITISAGIATREDDELIDSVIKRADKNLYLAKEQGRNRVVS